MITDSFFAAKDLIEIRTNICSSCEFLSTITDYFICSKCPKPNHLDDNSILKVNHLCSVCGCLVKAKIVFASSACPKLKW